MTAGAPLVSSLVSVTPMVGRCRCRYRVWPRVWEVFGLLWTLRAGFPAGADHRLLALSVLGGRSWWRVMSLVGLPRVLLQIFVLVWFRVRRSHRWWLASTLGGVTGGGGAGDSGSGGAGC